MRGVGGMGLWGGKVEYQEGWVEYNPGYREGDEMRLHDISVRCILLVVVWNVMMGMVCREKEGSKY